ncbi:MAG: glycosyltransferase family 4 protein [Thermoanaerobaculia bacterium]
MRIAYIAPGAAGMYCGSCIHDNTLATALVELGHDVAMLPLYTPIRTDEPSVASEGIFYGAANVYLQQALRLARERQIGAKLEQALRLFRRTPRALDRLFDSGAMLGLVSRLAGASDAASLGPLTLSMLRGEEGRQRKELARLSAWLAEFRPDVVQLGNGMLIGLAREIHRATGAPVVSGLTGEDLFVDGLPEPYRGEVVAELRRRAAELAGFVAPSRYYADRMRELLAVPTVRIHVVPLGVNLEHFAVPAAAAAGRADPNAPVTVGYLARICPEKGLHLLVDAFIDLAEEPGAEDVRLEVGGWVGKRDRPYLGRLERRVRRAGLGERAIFHGELDGDAKRDLLRRIDLFSVPTTYRESKGLFVLEALAHGVPVVQPAHGAFPELIAATTGGLLVEPDSTEALTTGLLELIRDPERRRRLGRLGRDAVERQFDSRTMAERTAAVYRNIVTSTRTEA